MKTEGSYQYGRNRWVSLSAVTSEACGGAVDAKKLPGIGESRTEKATDIIYI